MNNVFKKDLYRYYGEKGEPTIEDNCWIGTNTV